MEELKAVFAANLVQLRRDAGMTQLELAERLHFSDKAVSKWERGESVPDVATLLEIAGIFGVTVDYLCRADHTAETATRREYTKRQQRNHAIIVAMSSVLVWLLATFVFVNIDLIAPGVRFHWLAFVYAVPITAVVVLVFNSVWGNRRWNFSIISLLMWSTLATVYLTLLSYNLWLIFLLGIPGQIIILLWSRLK